MSSSRSNLSPELNPRGLSQRPVEAWCIATFKIKDEDMRNDASQNKTYLIGIFLFQVFPSRLSGF